MGEAKGDVAVGRAARVRRLTPGELAWVALLPCAAATVAAIVVLGPPLGAAVFRSGGDALWPPTWWEARGHAEPTEQARYLLAILGPLLLTASMIAIMRRGPVMRPRAIAAVVSLSEALAIGFVALAFARRLDGVDPPRVIGLRTVIEAVALVIAALAALRRQTVAEHVERFVRESRTRRWIALALALALIVSCVLQAVTTDRLVEDGGQMNWTVNDAFAVLDGRTPLVDYHPIYAKLLPYPAALTMALFGTTGFVYSVLMAALSGAALLAVYAVFRRLTRSSVLAIALFVPFVAIGEFEHPLRMAAMWPMRYGAYAMAWLAAWWIDRRAVSRGWLLFFAAGLLAINMTEFGGAALAATVAAVLCGRPRRAGGLLALARSAAAGLAAAVACVAALTLMRSGELPRLSVLLEWPRIFGTLGWFSLPMPAMGLHLLLYATFAGAVGTAVARTLRAQDDDPLLTGMLAWSGVFGLLAGSYYVGRSEHFKLISLFSAWAFALVPLTVAVVRALSARGWRRPRPAEVLVLVAFAVTVCSIGHIMSPVTQIHRLRAPHPEPTYRTTAEDVIRQRTHAGERVALLIPEGHRIAYDLGVRNVSPYALQNAIVTRRQLNTLIAVLRREDVRTVIVPLPGSMIAGEGDTALGQISTLAAAGYSPVRKDPGGLLELLRIGSADGS